MTVIVDASLALKWVIYEEGTREALSLWDVWQGSGELLAAPPVFKAEITNALHQKVRRSVLQRSDASDALEILLQAVGTIEHANLYSRALVIADELRIGSAYDALYLAAAESENCELWTADQRFVNAAKVRFPEVHSLGEAS